MIAAPSASATDTAFTPFGSNAAVLVNAGDNTGYETNPANAVSSNNAYAVDLNSGDLGVQTCFSTRRDQHKWYNFNLAAVPDDSIINGITVLQEIKADSVASNPATCVRLSWDGGTTWTTVDGTGVKKSAVLTIGDLTYYFPPGTTVDAGGQTDTWGRTWSASEVKDTANFIVETCNVADNTSRDFSLDYLAVRISYVAPKVWNGAGANANVSNGANWAGGAAPATTDRVVFPSGTKAATWDASAPATIDSVIIKSGYVNDVTLARSLTVTGDVTVNAGSLSLNGQTVTVQGGDITGAGRIFCGNGNDTCGGGLVFLQGTGSLGNNASAGYTFYQLDTGGASQTTTLQGPITVKGDFYGGQDAAVPSAHTFDTNSSGNYAMTVNGSLYVYGLSGANAVFNANGSAITVGGRLILGSPWDGNNDGTFNAGSSTLTLSGTDATSVLDIENAGNVFNAGTGTVKYTNGGASVPVTATSVTYNTLEFSGSGTYVLGTGATQTLTTTNFTLTQGTVTAATNDPTINISGNVSLSAGTTYTKGSVTMTLSGSGKTITDSNATTNNLGVVSISGSYSLSSSVRLTRVSGGGSLILNANTLTLTGNNQPLNMSGTVTASSGSTVEHTSGSGALLAIMTYHHLKLNGSGTFSLQGTTTINGNFDITSGLVNAGSYTINLLGNLTVGSSGNYADFNSSINFSGTAPAIWTDNSSGGPVRLGNITCNKTNASTSQDKVTLGSSVGARTVTVGGVNSEADADTLDISNYTLNLHNSGTPLTVRTGATLTTAGSTVAFVGPTGTTVPAMTYYNLAVKPGFDVATHTFAMGTFTINGNLIVGNGTNTSAVADASVNATTLNVSGNVTINANSTLKAHGSSAFNVTGNWSNGGTFNANGGVVTFNASDTDNTITSGGSSFSRIFFNNATGRWALQDTLTMTNYVAVPSGSLSLNGKDITFTGGFGQGIVGGGRIYCGNGDDTCSTGTVTIDTTNMVIGGTTVNSCSGTSGTYTFYNLTLGDGVGGPATTTQCGSFTVKGALTVAADQVYAAGAFTTTLAGSGTVFNMASDLLTEGSSTFEYACTGNCTINESSAYKHLKINATTNAIQAAQADSATLIVSGNLSLTQGQLTRGTCMFLGAPFGCQITVGGNWTTTTGATLEDRIANTVFNGSGTQTLTSAGMGQLGHVYVQGSGNTLQLQDDAIAVWGFDIGTASASSGILNMNGKNLSVGWNGVIVHEGGAFTKGAGTLTMSGAGVFTWQDLTGTQDFGPVSLGIGTVNLGSNVKAGPITMNGGAFALGTYNLTVGDGTLTTASITDAPLTSGTITQSASGTTTLNGAGNLGGANYTFYNLYLGGDGQTTTLTGPVTVSNTFWCGSGAIVGTAHTCDTGSDQTLIVNGQFQIFGDWTNAASSPAIFKANGSAITVGGYLVMGDILDADGKGTFNAGSSTLTLTATDAIAVAWLLSGSTFNAGTGRVIYTHNGGNVPISALLYNDLTVGTSGTTTSYALSGNTSVGGIMTVADTVGNTNTLNLNGQTLTLSGTGTPLVLNGEGFTVTNSTVAYTHGTSANVTATTYNNLQTGGGTYTAAGNIIAANSVTVTAGTLAMGANNLTIGTGASNGHLVGTGAITQSSAATTTLKGSGNLGGTDATTPGTCNGTNGSFQFYNLTVGDNANAKTTTACGDVTVSNIFTIAGGSFNQTFNGGTAKTLTLTLAGSPFVINGTFTPNTGKIKYTGGSATSVKNTTYYDLETNGAGPFNAAGALIATNTVTVTAGTLAMGVNDLTVGTGGANGFIVGAGAITQNAANSTTLQGNANLGGTSAAVAGTCSGTNGSFQFGKLKLGSGSHAQNTYLCGAVTVSGDLTIQNIQIFRGDSVTLANVTLAGSGTPFINNGIFTHNNTVKITYTGGGTTSVTAATYYDLEIGAAGTYNAAGTLVVNDTLTISAGTLAMGANNLTMGLGSIVDSGSIMVASGASLSQSSSNTTTIKGWSSGANCIGSTGTSCAGTVGTITFGNLTIGAASGTITTTATGDFTVSGVLTVAASSGTNTLNSSNRSITLSGSSTPLVVNNTEVLTTTGSTVTYTSATGATIGTTNIAYNNLTINRAAQNFVVGGTLTLNGDLTVTAGSLSLNSQNATVSGGDITGNGTIYCGNGNNTCVAGTMTLTGTGNMSGVAHTFYNLQLGTGSAGATTLQPPQFTVNGDLTVSANQSLSLNNIGMSINGGDITGAGTIYCGNGNNSCSNGVVTIDGAGNVGGGTYAFYRLFATGDGTATTAAGDVTCVFDLLLSGNHTFEVGSHTLTAGNINFGTGVLSMTGSGGKLKFSGGGGLSGGGGTVTVADVATPIEWTTADTGTPTYISVSITNGATINIAELNIDYLNSAGVVIGATAQVTQLDNVTWGAHEQTSGGTDVILDVTDQTLNLLNHTFPVTSNKECNVRSNSSGTVTMWDWGGGFGGENNDCDNDPAEVIWKGGPSGTLGGSGSIGAPTIY